MKREHFFITIMAVGKYIHSVYVYLLEQVKVSSILLCYFSTVSFSQNGKMSFLFNSDIWFRVCIFFLFYITCVFISLSLFKRKLFFTLHSFFHTFFNKINYFNTIISFYCSNMHCSFSVFHTFYSIICVGYANIIIFYQFVTLIQAVRLYLAGVHLHIYMCNGRGNALSICGRQPIVTFIFNFTKQ